MDAGDYNKYVTFAASPVHMLLTSYRQNPGIFTDDFNIPESGNGIPDIIDEVRYELE
jgi:endoglucanase